jgi:hypothetical protein
MVAGGLKVVRLELSSEMSMAAMAREIVEDFLENQEERAK